MEQARRCPRRPCRATGVAVNVLIRSDLDRMLGLSAIIGIGSAVVVLALGLSGRSRRTGFWFSSRSWPAVSPPSSPSSDSPSPRE